PSDEDGGADDAAHPRAERPPEAPRGRPAIRLPRHPAAGLGRTIGPASGLADLLRRIAGEGGGGTPRRRGQRAVGGGVGSAGGPHRTGQEERGLIMAIWDDPSRWAAGAEWLVGLLAASSVKAALVFASGAVAAVALRRASASARHLAW